LLRVAHHATFSIVQFIYDYYDNHQMSQRTPPHPGKVINKVYLKPNGLSGRELASKLGVSASTLSRVLSETSAISPEMALRLSKALGQTAESWLAMQNRHDLAQAKRRVKLVNIRKVKFTGK
jgi:addiction module HigA family antidote